jgi:hypothetical protein
MENGFGSGDRGRFTQMRFFHGHPPAAIADIFHRRQLILADMFGIHLRRAAEAAILGISARVAQMPRGLGHGTAVFACISHRHTSFHALDCIQCSNNDNGSADVKPEPSVSSEKAIIAFPLESPVVSADWIDGAFGVHRALSWASRRCFWNVWRSLQFTHAAGNTFS